MYNAMMLSPSPQKDFEKVTKAGFALAAAVYMCLGLFTYSVLGEHLSGNGELALFLSLSLSLSHTHTHSQTYSGLGEHLSGNGESEGVNS
jgi:purine-cytosine permease-like protein